MSVPVPPFFEHLGRRPFVFYPAIQNVDQNKWFYRKATWSEILVQNARTHEEVWIPRRYLGDVARLDEPVACVMLTHELEFQAGRVLPAQRRVIEMPRAVNEGFRQHVQLAAEARPAPVVGIRVENEGHSRVIRFLIGGISLGMLGCVLLVSFYRGGILGNRVIPSPVLQSDLGLGATDDYAAVIRKLGHPADERWRPDAKEWQLLGRLSYPRQGVHIILKGHSHGDAHYIGVMDRNWNPVHSVDIPGEGNSYALLRSLARF